MKTIGLIEQSRPDPSIMRLALQRMESEGRVRFKDIHGVPWGSNIREKIHENMSECDVLVIYIDMEVTSISVKADIEYAWNLDKPLLPMTTNYRLVPTKFLMRHWGIIDTLHDSVESVSYKIIKWTEHVEMKMHRSIASPPQASLRILNHPQIKPLRTLFNNKGSVDRYIFKTWLANVFEQVPGWEIVRVSDDRNDQGFDIVIWNSLDEGEFALFGNVIAVETRSCPVIA